MNLKNTLVAVALAGAVGTAYGASTIVVDDFDTPAFSLAAAGSDLGDTVPGTDTSLSGTVLRDVVLANNGGSGSLGANNDAGYVEWSNGPLRNSTLTISYTFSQQDLSSGSAFSFLLVGSDTIAANAQVTVTTASGLLTSPVTVVPTAVGLFNIPMGSFTGSGSFTTATGIEFDFTTVGAGADRAIDAFGIDLPPVPEASTYAAVGFMSLAAFGAYRRARK